MLTCSCSPLKPLVFASSMPFNTAQKAGAVKMRPYASDRSISTSDQHTTQ